MNVQPYLCSRNQGDLRRPLRRAKCPTSFSSLPARAAPPRIRPAPPPLPGWTPPTRALVASPRPHSDPAYASGIYTPSEARTPRQSEVVGVSDIAVDELFAADHIVLATGFINFSISSTLKSWIDHVSRSGKTFAYSANGPKGMVTGKKVYIVLASGGIYSEGPAAASDFAVPYLKSVLAFNGMTDVEVIRVEGVGMGEDAAKAALAKAATQIDEIAAKVGGKVAAAA